MSDKDKEARLAAALRENLRKRKAGTAPAKPPSDLPRPDDEGTAR
nr:hypothetical protein [uncultured Sphingomonas sp.]